MLESRTKELKLEYRVLPESDILKAHSIEAAEYPESEAGSLENFRARQSAAPFLFLGCYSYAPITPANPTTSSPTGQEQEQDEKVGDDHEKGGVLVGYIVSTQALDDHLTHASMSSHDPNGKSVCIHSVCVSKAYQRRGIATEMLKEYLQYLESVNTQQQQIQEQENPSLPRPITRLERVLLITHRENINLYSGAGFKLVGLSSVEHGPDPWYEMVVNLV